MKALDIARSNLSQVSRAREAMPECERGLNYFNQYFTLENSKPKMLWARENGIQWRKQVGEGVIASDSWRPKEKKRTGHLAPVFTDMTLPSMG